MATTNIIMDLATRREYIAPLIEEIKQIRATDGEEIDDDGYIRLKKESINKLRKLDSFMKESQRFSPPIYSKSTTVRTRCCFVSSLGRRWPHPKFNE